jgi:hypothetical protein
MPSCGGLRLGLDAVRAEGLKRGSRTSREGDGLSNKQRDGTAVVRNLVCGEPWLGWACLDLP